MILNRPIADVFTKPLLDWVTGEDSVYFMKGAVQAKRIGELMTLMIRDL